jgi:thioredoxin-related protein
MIYLHKNLIYTFIVSVILQISLLADDINLDLIAQKPSNSDKHLLIYLHKTDCGYCEKMAEFTLDYDPISKLIKDAFVFIDINVKLDGEVIYKNFRGSKREFAIYLKRDFYPSTVFMDTKGDIVFAQSGYVDEDNYLPALRYIETKSYKKMPFDEFENDYEFKKSL